MNNSIYQALTERAIFCTSIHAISKVGENIYISDSGSFLPLRESVEAVIKAGKNYLSHITPEQIESYNAWLLETRKSESQQFLPTNKEVKVSFIYLMRNNTNGFFKIGFSKSPSYRETTLQSQEPDITLIFQMLGGPSLEKVLHQKFRKQRIRGEWFRLSEEDINFIKNLGTV